MSKYLTIFLILILAILGYFTYRLSFAPEKLMKDMDEKGKNIEAFNFQNWKVYASPNGEFKVLFPTLPQHATESTKDPATGKPSKYDIFVSEKGDGTVFMITVLSSQDKDFAMDKQGRMKKMVNDLVGSKPNYTLGSTDNSIFKGHDALDFVITNKDLQIDGKTFFNANQQFTLSRIMKKENYNANEYNFFVNSFDLVPSSAEKQ